MVTYVYRHCRDAGVFTVGCEIGGEWEPESDHLSEVEAAARVRCLNGESAPAAREAKGTAKQCPIAWLMPDCDDEGAGCLEGRCAWWNEDFRMCAIAALAEAQTSEIVREEFRSTMSIYKGDS